MAIDLNLLDVPELAARLHKSQDAVRKMLWRRKLPFVKEGKKLLVSESDLAAYLKRHSRPAIRYGTTS